MTTILRVVRLTAIVKSSLTIVPVNKSVFLVVKRIGLYTCNFSNMFKNNKNTNMIPEKSSGIKAKLVNTFPNINTAITKRPNNHKQKAA